jgi:hypothetical protein
MPSVVHDTTRYANNRAEVSHQRTRQRERHMRRFKSVAQAQRFLAVHDAVRNLFTIGRHQLRAAISDFCARAHSLRGTLRQRPDAFGIAKTPHVTVVDVNLTVPD